MQRMLVIFDLDETLIHGSEARLERPCNFVACGKYFVYTRPHAEELVASCLEDFDVAVWTSASLEYAFEVVRVLFGEPSPLKFLWARERCTWRFDPETGSSHWLKNLKKVKTEGFDPKRVLMVDDSSEKLKLQYGNHILVRQYLGAQDDDELSELLLYLRSLDSVEDVRRVEKRGWKARLPR